MSPRQLFISSLIIEKIRSGVSSMVDGSSLSVPISVVGISFMIPLILSFGLPASVGVGVGDPIFSPSLVIPAFSLCLTGDALRSGSLRVSGPV